MNSIDEDKLDKITLATAQYLLNKNSDTGTIWTIEVDKPELVSNIAVFAALDHSKFHIQEDATGDYTLIVKWKKKDPNEESCETSLST